MLVMFDKLPVRKQKRLISIVHTTMAEWYGFDLTKTQIVKLLDENYSQWFAEILVNGLDAPVREGMANTLAQKCAKKRWPEGHDTDETFWTKLAKGAKQQGYRPTQDAIWNFKKDSTCEDDTDSQANSCLEKG